VSPDKALTLSSFSGIEAGVTAATDDGVLAVLSLPLPLLESLYLPMQFLFLVLSWSAL
jgi:hypothetical protein